MKKITQILIAALLTASPLLAQNDIAIVEDVKGVLVFTDCTPLAEYDIIGEVTYIDEAYNAYSSIPPRYQEIKMGLVINAILAHRDVEGIITTINDNGTGSAQLLKFKPNAVNKDRARVNTYKGLLYFANNKPAVTYQTVKSLKGPSSFRYGIVRKHFIKKANKRSMRNKGVNAIVVDFKKGVRDNAQLIKL